MKSFPQASAEGGSGVGLVLDDWGHLLGHRHPSWPRRSSGWEGMVMCWVGMNIVSGSFSETSWSGWPSSASVWTSVGPVAPPSSSAILIPWWMEEACHPQDQARPGCLTSVVLDKIPQTLTRENRWSFCCPPDCVSGSFVKICPHRGPGISSLTGSMEVMAPGGEGKDSQDSLLEERTAHESTEKGWKERGEEKPVHPQRSSKPRDSWAEHNNGSLCFLPGLPFAQHHPGTWGPKGSHPGATGSLGLSRLGGHRRGLGHCSWWRKTFL